jgi:hypothetical protein
MAPPPETIETLRLAMEAAAERGDFEEAVVLRDRISILRGMAHGSATSDFDTRGLVRQQPGAMGLGTSQQSVVPPEGWVRPTKPDLTTKGRPSEPDDKRWGSTRRP